MLVLAIHINVGVAEGKDRLHTLGDVCRRSRREERGEDVVEAKKVEKVNAMRARDFGENILSDRVILIYSGYFDRTRSKYRDWIAGALETGRSM